MPHEATSLLRPELTELPLRMRGLPIDERGYPVPWFVPFIDGQPEFRMADAYRRSLAMSRGLCWVCGGTLGQHKVFLLGPMCGISRTTLEPPCHLQCAEWSVRNCPFLSRPHMVRRGREEVRELSDGNTPGEMIERNPGVTLLWRTRTWETFRDGRGGKLIRVGVPEVVEWWAEGRAATRAEIEHSITTGLPALTAMAAGDTRELSMIEASLAELRKLMPD